VVVEVAQEPQVVLVVVLSLLRVPVVLGPLDRDSKVATV